MKKMNSIIALVLVLVMASIAMISCKPSQKNTPETDNVSETNGTVGTTLETDENGYVIDGLGKQDFGRKEITILYWQRASGDSQFEFDGDMSNTFEAQVHIRNLNVKSRLNVELKWQPHEHNEQKYVTTVRTLAGDGTLDILASYSMVPAMMMQEGLICDLLSLDYLDFNMPWWNQTLVKKNKIYNHMYFCGGDISPDMLGETFVIFANKNMAQDQKINETIQTKYGCQDLYDLVYQQKWTLDKMIQLSKDVTSSTASKGSYSTENTYGFATYCINIDSFYQGAGMFTIENAADGSLVPSDDFGSARTHSLVSSLINFFNDSSSIFDDYDPNDVNCFTSWYNGNVLFFSNTLQTIKNNYEHDMSIYILPVPKYDEDQEDYNCIPGFYHTLWSIPIASNNKSESAAVLECLASESYRTVMPTYYEKLLRVRYTESIEDFNMIDFIKGKTTVDIGRILNKNFQNKTWSTFRDTIRKRENDWMSAYKGIEDILIGGCTSTNDMIRAIEKR